MDTSFYKNPSACHLAIHLILSAAWKDHKITVGGNEILIMRGQVPTGRKKLSDETGLSQQCTRTVLKILKRCGFLTIKSTNKLSIITICKYNDYQTRQPANQPAHQPAHQPATNQQPTSNQPLQNKGNKEKKGNNNTYSVSFLSFWNEYPVKKGKGSAYKSWLKKKPDIENVLLAIKNQIDEKEKLKANQQFCPEWPHPTTWLNQERWDDEEYDIKGEEDGLARFLQRHQDTG